MYVLRIADRLGLGHGMRMDGLGGGCLDERIEVYMPGSVFVCGIDARGMQEFCARAE